MDRWNFSWDLIPGPPQKSMAAIIPVDKPEDSNLGENTAAEREKAVKLAKGGAFNSRHRYFSAFATPLCLSASCYPSLSLQAIVLTEKIVPT